jgi:cyclopropane-fatty-acyl-phospholipid synthase
MITSQQARELLERIFRDHPTKTFAVRLWDGSEIAWSKARDFTLVFKDAETFRNLFASRDPSLFAEAYINKTFDIEGDLYEAIALSRYLKNVKLGFFEKLGAATKLGVPSTRHTKEDDARDVQAHYDLSNEFYGRFLDERMVYSCAYFSRPGQSLKEAQERKLDLICRKLRLKPGESFLDVGCGWGALVIWAVQHYGVTAHGITLSKNQFALATERVRQAGLQDKIKIELRHYLDLPENVYDKIASIGMYEHVGIKKYPEYFGALRRALKPGGLFLNHGITASERNAKNTGGEFIFRHVFPGAELDTISHSLVEMENTKWEILDVEQLRPHYALTLRAWMENFMKNEEEAAKWVPEKVMRVWKLYLPGCAIAFEEGRIGVYQTLAAKQTEMGHHLAPLTREDMLTAPLGLQKTMEE